MVTNAAVSTLADLVRRPLVTEKATLLMENNQYVFEVIPTATKPDIKAAIEELFEVTVTAVNTYNPPSKRRRFGRFVGNRPHYKRAVVTLAPGDSIPLFPDL